MGTIPSAPTFTAGQVVTAAELNELRDCIDFWAKSPRCFAYDSSGTSLPTGTLTPIALDAERYDIVQSGDSPMHDLSTNNSRIYVRTPGRYEITGQVQFPYDATGYRYAAIYVNTTQYGRNTQGPAPGGISTTCAVIPFEVDLSAGDYVSIHGFQNSGSTYAATTGQQNTWLRVTLVAES